MKQITVTIDADGNVIVATSGFSGTECLKETMSIEAALGTTTRDVKTREASTTTTASASAKQGAGR